jgi:hypothetical protein
MGASAPSPRKRRNIMTVSDAWVVYLDEHIMGVYPNQANAQEVFEALKDPETDGTPRIVKSEIRSW